MLLSADEQYKGRGLKMKAWEYMTKIIVSTYDGMTKGDQKKKNR